MRWFRSRSTLGSWLSLIALSVQFARPYGQSHLDRPPPPGHSSVLLRALAFPAPHPVPQSAPDEAPGQADDYCAVSPLTHLAGTIVGGEPPVLPLPAAFGRA